MLSRFEDGLVKLGEQIDQLHRLASKEAPISMFTQCLKERYSVVMVDFEVYKRLI